MSGTFYLILLFLKMMGQRIGILCGFVAVTTEWLMTHHCLLSILDGLDFMFGKMFQQGCLLTGLYLFRSWSNSISGGGFIWRFLKRRGFTLPVYHFAFSDSS